MSIYKIDYKTYDVLTGVLQQLGSSTTQGTTACCYSQDFTPVDDKQ
jgi:hypothetical protein